MTKTKIAPEALSAYKRALALHNAPLPADPVARQTQQQAYYQECEALRVALDRNRHRVCVLDTLESDDVPYFILGRGPALADDWRSAIAIRKALEQLVREEIIDGWCEDHSRVAI